MSKSESASEYEIQYRSTIQPRTAVRSQSRQSGNYVSGGTGGGGGETKSAKLMFVKYQEQRPARVQQHPSVACSPTRAWLRFVLALELASTDEETISLEFKWNTVAEW
ncbi:hypothetical protein Aduo_005557 [Ancylostoma duodenale]